MKHNQFYPVQMGVNIKEVKASTKKKRGYITIELPDEVVETLLKQLGSNSNEPIKKLDLCWHDVTKRDDAVKEIKTSLAQRRLAKKAKQDDEEVF